jgi:hypothetical protein
VTRSADVDESTARFTIRLLQVGATSLTDVVGPADLLDDPAYAPGRTVTVTRSGAGAVELGPGDVYWPWVSGTLLLLLGLGRLAYDRVNWGHLHYYR